MSTPTTTEAYRRAQWAKALANEPTRFVLADIAFGQCGVLRDSYVKDSDLATYNAGLRAAGLAVLSEARQADPAAYLALLSEYEAAGERIEAERLRRQQANPNPED